MHSVSYTHLIDEGTRQPLKNAIFSISKANGEIVKDRAETDETGIITLTGLTDCTLIVTEIEAPDGYILQDMPKTIEVKAGGDVYKRQPLQLTTFRFKIIWLTASRTRCKVKIQEWKAKVKSYEDQSCSFTLYSDIYCRYSAFRQCG